MQSTRSAGTGALRPLDQGGARSRHGSAKGGHTDDYGFDVVVHFHGARTARKYLVQVARGVVFVGVDFGEGSGRYAKPYKNRTAFSALLRGIEKTLRRHSGQPNASIRHLALTAWSAGYGAVNEILRHGDERVDAVVLLDGLHAGSKPGLKFDGKQRSVSAHNLGPIFEFARRATKGEKLFVLTHGQTGPTTYPSVKQTATLLLGELGLERSPVDAGPGPFDQLGKAEQGASTCGIFGEAGKTPIAFICPSWREQYATCSSQHGKHLRWTGRSRPRPNPCTLDLVLAQERFMEPDQRNQRVGTSAPAPSSSR